MTIGKRFLLTSGVCLVLTAVLAVTAALGFRNVSAALSDVIDDTMPSNRASLLLLSDIYRMRGDYMAHIAASAPVDMDAAEQAIRTDRDQLEQDYTLYKNTIDDNDEDRGNYATLRRNIDQMNAGWEKVYPLSRADKNAEANALYATTLSVSLQQASDTTLKMVAYNKRVADKNAESGVGVARRTEMLAIFVGLLALVLGSLVSWFMITRTNQILRETTATLSEGSEQVTSAASQVSSSSQVLAESASEQAATIEETSAAAAEINSMASRSSENARTTVTIVSNSQTSFKETGVLLEDLQAAMKGIGVSSAKISKIIKIIDDIAFQTNILALNAAVEAARAGEAGLGFAVVADEVRALAQRSAKAAKDTAELIEESINQAGAGRSKVDHVAEAMRSLSSEIAKIKSLVDEIEMGSVEQAKGIGQISGSITQIEQATQNSAANAEESAAAAEELNTQAQSMRDTIGQILALVEGQETTRSGGASRHAAPSKSRGVAYTPAF